MELGKVGCFFFKISRKEKVRRFFRLKFSLGKSSKDVVSVFYYFVDVYMSIEL